MGKRTGDLTQRERAFLASYEQLHAQWQAAHRAAEAAEAELLAALRSCDDGSGPAPSPQQWEAAQRLRVAAQHALDRALMAVRSTPL